MDERTKALQKQYRLTHKAELAEKKKRYYLTHKERINANNNQRRADHLEEYRAMCNRSYHKHSDRINDRMRERRKPMTLHRLMIKEFKSLYEPWNGEGCEDNSTSEIYQIDFSCEKFRS